MRYDSPVWTVEREAILRNLIDEGFSARQIAQRINDLTGSAFSRNAVIAKVHRHNLEFKRKTRPITIIVPKQEPYKPSGIRIRLWR